MTMSDAPIASGAMTPGAPGMTVQPTVSTRKKVPMNSVRYLFMVDGARSRSDERASPTSDTAVGLVRPEKSWGLKTHCHFAGGRAMSHRQMASGADDVAAIPKPNIGGAGDGVID